jgi:hypothetical protein
MDINLYFKKIKASSYINWYKLSSKELDKLATKIPCGKSKTEINLFMTCSRSSTPFATS